MRICYLADATSIHTQRWVNYFAARGHEVHLISLRPAESDYLRQVKLYPLKLVRGIGQAEFPHTIRQVNLPLAMLQIKRMVAKLKPEILHAHFVTDYGFMGALCGFHPLVMTAWGSDVLVAPKQSRLLGWTVKFALTRADAITCDGEHLIESMVRLGAAREKIRLIYFGVDTRKFNPQERDETLKGRLGLPPDSRLVISLRSLYPLYDVESLVKAAPLVLSEVPEARFIVAGRGEQRDCLEQLAASLGVADYVRFVGLIPNADLPRYLASSNVYVSTSLSDAGLASSTAEAMACGLPVVITDFGDNGKWVKDGQGEFLVVPQNPTMLAEKIVDLLKHPEVCRTFGQINRKVIEERNDYYKEMSRMEIIYQELVERYR